MNSRINKHPGAKFGQVLYEDPSDQSQAALALMSVEFWKNDPTIYRAKEWEAFRIKFFEKIIESEGSVTCHYCTKKNLIVDGNDPRVSGWRGRKMLATIDHITPLSKGGEVYDESNLVPACYPCNVKKGNKSDYQEVHRSKKI